METTQKDFLTIIEFAAILGMHHNTVRRAIKNGRISAFKLGAGNRASYRIPRSEIQRIAEYDVNSSHLKEKAFS